MRRLAWLLLLAGCSSDSNAPNMVNLAGRYEGNYSTTSSPGQGFNARLLIAEMTSPQMEGTLELPSGTLPLPFTGSYSRDTVTLVVSAPPPYYAGGTATFAVSDGGKHLVGALVGIYGAFAGQTFSFDLQRLYVP